MASTHNRRSPGGRPTKVQAFIWDMLTFERLMTGPIVHLIYWAGMAVVAIIGFGLVGTSIGLFIRDFSFVGLALAAPVLVVGLLVTAALAMVWRGICEFYLAVFRIAEDLRALRLSNEAASRPPTPPAPPTASGLGGVEL